MKQLNKIESIIFVVGALLMLAGAIMGLFKLSWFPYVYAIGAIGFASMQMLQRYEGTNFVIRRLRRIMVLSDVLFLLTAVLMFANQGNALGCWWQPFYSSILPIELVMNWKKKQKNNKRLRNCFKLRKFFFSVQDIIVHLHIVTQCLI